MQLNRKDLLEASRSEANKWLNYGLEKDEEKEINNLLKEGNEDDLLDSF